MSSFIDSVRGMITQRDFFHRDRPVWVSRAPGRLDLMGGNDDYTGGLVFEMTIREATWAAAQLRDDSSVVLRNKTAREAGWRDSVEVPLEDVAGEATLRSHIAESPDLRWTAYVLGCIHYLARHHASHATGRGLTIYMDSNVPLNKGVSSSAAIEVAVMKAACAAYEIPLDGIALALACQWVENVIAGSACGVMDQIAVVMGDEGCVLPLVCQPCNPEPLVNLPQDLECWAVDSGVSHEVSGIEYEAARAAAFMGYKLICDLEGLEVRFDDSAAIPRYIDSRWNGYLANLPRSEFHERYEERLPVSMTGAEYLARANAHVDPFTACLPDHAYRIRANTRYAVEENQRVQLFVELARAANNLRAYRLLGELMYQSHFAYTECGLGNPATDALVDLARHEGADRGIFGAKVTGGGAGGTVAILGRKDARPAIARIVARYAEMRGCDPYLFEGSSIGADKFGIVRIEQGNPKPGDS